MLRVKPQRRSNRDLAETSVKLRNAIKSFLLGGIHKGHPADPRGEGQKKWTKLDSGEGRGRGGFEILGRPKAKKYIFAFLSLLYIQGVSSAPRMIQ